MEPLNLLKQLEFSENEARSYLTLLEIKKATVSQIAKRVQQSRSTMYDALELLVRKGVVLKMVKNNKIVYWCDKVERVERFLEEQKRSLDQRMRLFHEHIPDLSRMFKAHVHEPKIRLFEGKESYKDFYQISIDERPKEIIGFASSHSFFQSISDRKFARHYIREKFQRNIAGRYFIQQENVGDEIKYLNTYYKKYLRSWKDLVRVKVMPSGSREYHGIHETMIFNDMLAISAVEYPFFGIIIASEIVAATQRIIFESLWKTVKEEIKI